MIASWRRLARIVGAGRAHLGAAAAVAVLQSALLAPVAVLVSRIFNRYIPARDTGAIVEAGLLMFAFLLASAAVGLVSRQMAAAAGRRAIGRLRKDLLDRLYALPPAWHDGRDPGVLHAAVVQDTERLSNLLTQVATSVLPAVVIGAGLSLVALWLNPLLFAVLVLSIPVSVLAARSLGKRQRSLFRTWEGRLTTFGAQTRVALRAMRLTKAHGAEAWELERRERQIDGVTDAAAALSNAQAAYGAVQGLATATLGIVALVVGGIEVSEGRMTLGDLIGFYAVAALMLRYVGAAVPGMATTAISAESLVRVEEILAAPPPAPGGSRVLEDFSGAVAAEGVSFGYRDVPVLREVDLDVAAGEHVALAGPNASGKSTLVSLLLGLYEPGAGRVTADGVPLEELDLASLRRRVGVVLQDAVILHGTVRDNIAYGRADAGDAEIREAARQAGAHAFIERLPGGYDAAVGDEGALLSGGQRQRIALARALLGRPALLILDEPTTHLDRAAIAGLLDKLATMPATVILVTHDIDVAAQADRVVYLRDGRVERVERGGRARPGAIAV